MGGNETSSNDVERDRDLDRALRESLPADSLDRNTIDPDLALAYLKGEATAEQAKGLRRLLAASPSMRRDILEIADDLERLESAEVATAFLREPVPTAPDLARLSAEPPERGPRPPQKALASTLNRYARDFFAPLFRRPVLVYTAAALVLACLIYPAYRHFSSPSEGNMSLLVGTGPHSQGTRFELYPDVRLRGGPSESAARIQRAECGSEMALTLWTVGRLRDDLRYRFRIMDARGTLLHEAEYSLQEQETRDRLHLTLRSAVLSPGELRIEVLCLDPTTDEVLATDRYTLLVE